MRSLLLITALATALSGAVGPDSTVVVINAASPMSRTVGETFARLRKIPPERRIVLEDVPTGVSTTLADFRLRLLDPLEQELTARGLAASTALVAWSADFPTAITADDTGLPQGRTGPASLTSLTLLAPWIADGPAAYTAFNANPYAAADALPGTTQEQAVANDAALAAVTQALTTHDNATAERLLEELAGRIPAPSVLYNLACVQARRGRLDEAEANLDRAIVAGWIGIDHARQDPDLAPLTPRPAWAGLVARMEARAQACAPSTSPGFTPLPPRHGSPPGRLATLLAPSGPRGLSTDEAVAMLERSVAADGTRPTGTVYHMLSSDQRRTGPRRWAFVPSTLALRAAGISAEVLPGVLPPAGSPVMGAVIGAATFDWPASGATLLPGAWADHLTSCGGMLGPQASQTPCTAFLRAGAAGSGGAVHEPRNIPLKFPSAFVHLHRVRGLTLVEAVYRTMPAPFQYLVVGDPLSKPW